MKPPLWILVALLAGACNASTGGPPASGADAATDAPPPDELNCVRPGTPNNEMGVGGYCETDADCKNDAGTGTLCSAIYGAPVHDWFCTKYCKMDSDCGSGEYCAHDPRGIACVPLVCGPTDAGPDASSTDSSSDAPPDAELDASSDSATD